MASIYDKASEAWKTAEAEARARGDHPDVVKARATFAYAKVMSCGDQKRIDVAATALQRRLREARMRGAGNPTPRPLEKTAAEERRDSVAGRMLAAGQMARARASCLG